MERVSVEMAREGTVLYPTCVSFIRYPDRDSSGEIIQEDEVIDQVWTGAPNNTVVKPQ